MQELKDNSLFTEGEEYIQIVLKKTEWIELFEKEKEQIKKAFEFGVADAYNFIEDEAEQYYNETYNSNKS